VEEHDQEKLKMPTLLREDSTVIVENVRETCVLGKRAPAFRERAREQHVDTRSVEELRSFLMVPHSTENVWKGGMPPRRAESLSQRFALRFLARERIHVSSTMRGDRCAVRHNFRKTQKSALILEKRHIVMPPGFPLQAVRVILRANLDFLKIDRIVVTFLKIARIFLKQNVPRRDLVRKYLWKNKNALQPKFRKIRSKIRKEAGIRTNFRKRAVQENVSECC
jgi:hypothetical protein